MMNLVALGLVLSSLAFAGVFSPHPDPRHHDHQPNSLLREAHRLIVVEYERQFPADHLPSSPPPPSTAETHQLIEEAKEKFQEAASVLPNLGQGLSAPPSAPPSEFHSAKEKIFDAYGVCKDKLSTLVTKGKDKASSKATQLEEEAKDAATQVEEGAKTAVRNAKERTTQLGEAAKYTANTAVERATHLKEGAKDAVKNTAEKTTHLKEGAKDTVKNAEDKAAQLEESTKDAVKGPASSSKETGKDTARNASDTADKAAEKAGERRRNLTDILRRATDVAFDAAAYVGSRETGKAAAAVLQLLGLAAVYGTCVWVTFVSSHVLAAALPRQQLGMVQSRLYPVYFRAVAYGVALALLSHYFGQDRRPAPAERLQSYNLLGALGLVLANMLFFEPKATKVMFERMKMEKEEGRGRDMADLVMEPVSTTEAATATATPTTATFGVTRTSRVAVDQDAAKRRLVKLNRRLKKLNTYSSSLNILTLMGLTWHLVHLARRLSC